MRLRFDVAAVPVSFPKKWPSEASTTQLTIAAWGVDSLQLSGVERVSGYVNRD